MAKESLMYYIYQLKDFKGFTFYVGITKNLEIRIKEHTQHKNATPAKSYRVRRVIKEKGYLPYTYQTVETKEEAIKIEADLIQYFGTQLVNKTHGKVKRESKQRRSKGRSIKCESCGNFFKRIGSHKCKIIL